MAPLPHMIWRPQAAFEFAMISYISQTKTYKLEDLHRVIELSTYSTAGGASSGEVVNSTLIFATHFSKITHF